jgi:PKD repeat protein
MTKTTKHFIVVFIAFVLIQIPGFAQYNGGIGDGANTDGLSQAACSIPPPFYAYFGGTDDAAAMDLLSQTACLTPPPFYPYFGGSGDGAHTDMLMNTACGTPPHFFAYMGGADDGAGVDLLSQSACGTPAPFFAYFGGTSDGAAIDNLAQTACGTPAQFYAYFGGIANGFAIDSEIICPAIPPVANFSANSTTVCAGTTVTFTDLSTNFPNTWSWSFAGGTPAVSTVQNPGIVYNTPGVYTVTLTATNAHGSNTKTVTGYITVNAIPTADAGSNVSICNGSGTTLNASGGASYSWLPVTGLSSATIANPVASPGTTTNYTVTVTNSGCSATDIVTITVNPVPAANAGSDVAICNGSSTPLSASGGSSYSWGPAAGLSSTTVSSPSASPTVTTTYTVTVTAAGCSSTDMVTVTVNPTPTANAGSDVTICNGTSTTLNASGGTAYSWSPAAGLSSASIANPVATPGSTTNYTVTVTSGGCSSTDVVTVFVTPLPAADAGSNASICSGSSTTLTAGGGTSYSWLPATGLSSTTISNPVANPASTTTYTVNVTNSGCSATDVVTVTVNTAPAADAGSNVTICLGSATILGATGGTSYSWLPATGLSSTIIANPIANPAVTTTYTVTVTNAGCSATDVVTVTIAPLPPADAGANASICSGGSATLNASGGASYSWTPATGLSSTTIANPVATPASTTNYTVSVTGGGCSATDVVTLTVIPLPAADAGSDVTICTGSSATLNASGGTSYSWAPPTGLSSASIANPVANPSTTTTYTVTVTNGGCTATDVVTVTVTTVLTADAGADTSACNGSSVMLNASGGTTYSWSPAAGLSSAVIANPVAAPSATTTYTVTAFSGGCSSTDAVTVTIIPLPTATVTAGGPTTFCQGDSVTLSTSGGSSYLWSDGSTNSSLAVLTSGNYSVTVTSASGCAATSAPVIVTVHAISPAAISAGGPTTFCQGGSVILTASAGSAYAWSNADTTQSIVATLPGTYSVSVDDINGCATSAASVTVTVNPNPALPVLSASGSTSLCLGDTVILSSDTASSYLWSTGAASASILVTTAGAYSVTNYNSFGCGTSSSSITVSVNDPLVDFTATPLLVFLPTANVSFTATPAGVPPYTYLWDFGDATTSALAAPGHTYGAIAYETVSLTLTDSTGCSKTITKPNYVEVEQLFPSWAMNTGTALDLTGVSFIDAQTGIMSMTDGNCLISLDSGNNWSPLPTGNMEPLTGACVIPGNWFVTGANGTILLSTNNGSSWTPFTTGTLETFNGSSFYSATDGYAVGTNGTIQRYNGVSWTPQSSGTTEHLHNVFALGSGSAIAVGDNQTILSYNGSAWTAQTSPLSFNVKDVRFSSPLNGYAAGTNGIILQTANGGTTWTPSLTGVDIDFNSIEVAGPDSAWAAGTNGIVYTTVDSGATWIRYSVGYANEQDEIRVTRGKGHTVGTGGHGRNFGEGSSLVITGNNAMNDAIGDLIVYPNPAKDAFSISATLPGMENLVIEIKDANGKLIERLDNTSTSGAFTKTVSTEHYRQGVYFIHFHEGERSWVKKVIIIK